MPTDGFFDKPATPRVIDFRDAKKVNYKYDGTKRIEDPLFEDDRPTMKGQSFGKGSSNGEVLATAKQIRARARRRARKGMKLTDEAFNTLYKPIEEWDDEELARGRPRNPSGGFNGPKPKWVSREVHERAMERFKSLVRSGMNVGALSALGVVDSVLTSDDFDVKGRPVVPYSTRLDAAKYLLDHVVGKPTQPIQTDISVKLQAILGDVMVNPAELPSGGQGYALAHVGHRALPAGSSDQMGVLEAEIVDDDEEGDDD